MERTGRARPRARGRLTLLLLVRGVLLGREVLLVLNAWQAGDLFCKGERGLCARVCVFACLRVCVCV